MLHGKKGFERIAWAFKNVLNHSVAWLFYDLSPTSNGISQGIFSSGARRFPYHQKMCINTQQTTRS